MSYDRIQLSSNPALFESGMLIAFLLSPLRVSCVQSHLKPYRWSAVVLPFPEVSMTTSNWPGHTLGRLLNPACQMCTHQHTTCSGRKPIFFSSSFSLGKRACLWHLSPLTLLCTQDKEIILFLKTSLPLLFKKKLLELSLNRRADMFLFLLSMSLKLPSFACLLFSLQLLLYFLIGSIWSSNSYSFYSVWL